MKSTHAWVLLSLLFPLSGCKLLEQKPQEEDPTEPVVADAFAVEFDSDGVEQPAARVRARNGVAFHYVASDELATALKAKNPQRVLVIAHGWMNDTKSARDFTSQFVRAALTRAERDQVPASSLAFVGVHWDSEQVNFFGSANTAEVIGRERLAPVLEAIGDAVPTARVLLVGHSLGARMVLSSLQGAGDDFAAGGAVLLEGAVDQTAILPDLEEGFGAFPAAPGRTPLLINVHSNNDTVLQETYARAMRSPALGLLGAVREGTQAYPAFALTGPVDMAILRSWLSVADSGVPGATRSRAINLDATAVVSGHSDIFGDEVQDVIWAASSLAAPRQ